MKTEVQLAKAYNPEKIRRKKKLLSTFFTDQRRFKGSTKTEWTSPPT